MNFQKKYQYLTKFRDDNKMVSLIDLLFTFIYLNTHFGTNNRNNRSMGKDFNDFNEMFLK